MTSASPSASASATAIRPWSANLSLSRTQKPSASGRARNASSSAWLRRRVVRLNWLVLLTSCTTRARFGPSIAPIRATIPRLAW